MAKLNSKRAYNKRKEEEEKEKEKQSSSKSKKEKSSFQEAYQKRKLAERGTSRIENISKPKVQQTRYYTQQEALKTGANVKDMEWYAREKAANRLTEYETYSDYLTSEVIRQKGGKADENTARQTVSEFNNWLNNSNKWLMQYAEELTQDGYTSKNKLNSNRKVLDDLAEQAGDIKTNLYANKSILGDQEVEEAIAAMDAYLNWNGDVDTLTKQKSEMMSQFKTEKEYDRAVKDIEYRNMTHEERMKEAQRLEEESYSELEQAMAEYEAAEGSASAEEQRRLLDRVYDLRQKINNSDGDSEAERIREIDSYLSAQEERARMEALDLDSAKAELDDLQGRRDELQSLKEEYITLSEKIVRADAMRKTVSSEDRERLAYLETELQKYGSIYDLNEEIESINSAIPDKTKYYNLSKNIQTANELAKVRSNSDFYEYKKRGKELAENKSLPILEVLTGIDTGQNKIRDDRNQLQAREAATAIIGLDNYLDQNYIRAKYITEEELEIYEYYIGKGDTENAEKYIKSIDEELSARAAGDLFEEYENNALKELAFSIYSGLEQFGSGVSNLFSNDDYIPDSAYRQLSGMVREDLGDVMAISDDFSVGQMLFDAGSSVGNMLPSILTSAAVSAVLTPVGGAAVGGLSAGAVSSISGAVGSGVLGLSAAGNAYAEMVNLGYDKGQARSYAALIGASEAGLQYILGGIGSLGKGGEGLFGGLTKQALQNVDNGLARVAIKLGGNMLSEGAEEYLQEIITPVLRNVALGENNEFHLFSADAVYSGILGALTAGVMEGGQTISEGVSTYSTGKTLKESKAVEHLKAAGSTYSADTVAYQLANRVDQNTDAYTIGRLFNEVNASLSDQNRSEIVNALVEKGVMQENAETIADAFSGVVDGVELTEAQQRMMAENDVVADAVREVLIDENSTVNQREAALLQVQSDVVTESMRQQAERQQKKEDRRNAKIQKATEKKSTIRAREEANQKTRRADENQAFAPGKMRVSEVGENSVLQDANGKKIGVEEANFSTAERAVYQAATSLDNTRAANAMINTFYADKPSGVTAADFASSYTTLYNAGKAFESFDQIKGTAYDSKINLLGESVARAAFYNGLNTAQQRFFSPETEAQVLKTGGVLLNTSKAVSNANMNIQLEVLNAVGKKYGTVIEVRDNLGAANGYFRSSDNRIVLSLDSEGGGILRVAGHELYHYLEKNSPDSANNLKKLVTSKLKTDPGYDYEGRVKWIKENNPGSDADAEITAESMFDVLTNEQEVKRLLKEESPSFLEKIKNWLDDFIGFIDDTIQRLKNRKKAGAEIRALEKDKKTLKEIRNLFYKGLEEAKKNEDIRNAGDGVRYSVMDFSEQVEQIENGTFQRGLFVYVGNTPQILADIGFNGNLPMLTTAQHIRKAMQPKDRRTHQHGLTEEQIKALPEKIANPVMIMDSLNPQSNAVVVVADMLDADGMPVIAAIRADGKGMFNDVEIRANFVLSYYGRDGFDNFIERNVEADTFLFIDKRKSRNLSNQAKVEFFGKLDRYDFDIIIRKTNANVNPSQDENFLQENADSEPVNKYSIKEAEENVTDKALLRENEHLKKMVASLKEEMKLTKGVQVKRADVEKLTRRFLREHRSSVDESGITAGLLKMFEYIGNNPDKNGETAFLMAENIARDILEGSKTFDPVLNEDYKEVRDYLRNNAVYFPQEVRSDILYSETKKELFGRLKIRKDGVPVDIYFSELQDMFPEFQHYDVQSGVQAADALVDIVNRVWTKTSPDGTEIDTAALELASEIFDAYFDIPQFHSFADKQKAKLNGLKREYRNSIKKLQAELKEKYEGRIGEVRNAYRTREREHIQKEKRDQALHSIARTAKNLAKRFLKPTDKQNIPVIYRKKVGEVLSDLGFDGIRLDSNKYKNAEWKSMLQDIKNMSQWKSVKANEKLDAFLDIDPDMTQNVAEVAEKIQSLYAQNGEKPIDLSEIDNETLYQINSVLQSLLHAVTNYNKVLSSNVKKTISQMGEQTIADNYGKGKKRGSLRSRLKQYFQIDAMSPETFLTGLGQAGKTIWDMFRGAETAKVGHVREAQTFIEAAYEKVAGDSKALKAFKKALNSKETIEHQFSKGKKIAFTKQQIMELYVLSRRDQAMQHIITGGIVTGGMTEAAIPTASEIVAFCNEHLTAEEREFAVMLQRYLSNEVATWGNEVTRLEFGYDKFTEEFYWPIDVDSRTTRTMNANTEENASLYAIRNLGMTKATNEAAENTIRINNIMDTFSEHIVNMASYNGYSLVVRDAMKWFNYQGERNRNVKTAIEEAYGTGIPKKDNGENKGSPTGYFIKFMKDLNGMQGVDNTFSSGMIAKATSWAKVAAVGANVRLVVQQPTAIVRALSVIDPKYFMPDGDIRKSKTRKKEEGDQARISAFKEATKYSTAAQLKSWGFRENNMSTQFSKIIRDSATVKEKITDISLYGAEKADAVTWGRIWNAAKRKTAAENPDLVFGSDEHLQRSGKLMDDVCYQTQVFDSILCRTQNMRSTSEVMRLLVAFTSEPAKSYNMLLQAFMSGNKKEIAKTVMLTTMSSVLATAAASFVSAGRDDDDYRTFWEKYLEAFSGDILDSINPFSSLPLASDIIDYLTGNDYDSPQFYEQFLENTISVAQYIAKVVSGDTKFDAVKFINLLAKALSTMTGVPFSNAYREIRTLWNNLPFTENKLRTSDYYVTKDSELYSIIFTAMGNGDQDTISRAQDELIKRGKTQEQLDAGLKSVLKERYKEDIAWAAEARQDGNAAEYERRVNEISEKTGLNITLVAETVESMRKKVYEEDDETESDIGEEEEEKTRYYTMEDANRALEEGNVSSAKKIIEQEYEYKVDSYLEKGEEEKDAEKKAKSSIRASLTSHWKPLYVEAYKANDTAEMLRIREFLYETGYYGNKSDVLKTMKQWISDKD